MADVTEVRSWKYIGEDIDENNDPESINLKKVPDKTLVYEVIGPMFLQRRISLWTYIWSLI